MTLVDVNVLIYAHREDAPHHTAYRQWLENTLNSQSAFGLSELVLSGFLRIVTHPKIFTPPSSLKDALTFANQLRNHPNTVILNPGNYHWAIFTELCETAGAKGNLIPDAYHAALAIETNSEWISTDGDFARFPKLKWRHPLR